MIVTDSESLRDLARSLRNQGRGTDAWLSHARLGYNYRLSDINAAIGKVQIDRLDEILAKRRSAAALYDQALGDIDEIHLPPMSERERASWFVYVIRLAENFTRADRDAIIKHLRADDIGCSNYFVPIHTQPYIQEMLGTKEGDFPLTEAIAARTIALPFFANLTEADAARVRNALDEAIRS